MVPEGIKRTVKNGKAREKQVSILGTYKRARGAFSKGDYA
jgi:hypothetical protein